MADAMAPYKYAPDLGRERLGVVVVAARLTSQLHSGRWRKMFGGGGGRNFYVLQFIARTLYFSDGHH